MIPPIKQSMHRKKYFSNNHTAEKNPSEDELIVGAQTTSKLVQHCQLYVTTVE